MKPLLLLALLPLSAFAELRVATLHPLLGELARTVGGDQVEVIDLVGPGADLHSFEPSPAHLRQLQEVALILASGKGLEPYLDSLRDNLTAGQKLVEIGASLPSLQFGGCDHPEHDHGHAGHDHGDEVEDPHWWHDISLMRRATRVVEKELAALAPEEAPGFAARSQAHQASLEELENWAALQLFAVPPGQRQLPTAHAAFAYFCAAYDFQAIPVRGLTQDHEPSAKELTTLIGQLQADGVAALFPEASSNDKMLQAISQETGIKIGGVLLADATGDVQGNPISYHQLIQHNVRQIVAALAGE
ncbi:MAG: metal ABC transporter substrate-binding protein [Verrucomicrobiota bacterium]